MAQKEREKPIETYLRDQVQLAGGLCWKWNSSSLNGVPDRIVFLKGNVVFVELKRPGGKPRDDQRDVHTRMALRGVPVMVIDNRETIDELIEDLREYPGHGGR